MSEIYQLNEAMWNAAEQGRAEEVQRLIQSGAKPDFMADDPFRRGRLSALHIASLRGHVHVLKVLLQCSCYINSQSRFLFLLDRRHNASALHWAAFGESVEAFIFLLSSGIDAGIKNAEGKTAFEYGGAQFQQSVSQRRNEMTKSLSDSSLKRSKSTIAAEAQTISSAADSHDVSESATKKKTAAKPEAENRGPSANVAYWRGRLEAAQESLVAATSQQESIENELKETGEAAAAIREAATASEDEVRKLQQELKEAELRNEENQRQLEAAEKAQSSSLNRSKEATLKLDQALKEEERCRGGHKDASKRLRRLCEAAETRDLATFDEEMVVELLKEIGLPTEVQELFKQNRIHGKHFEDVCCDTGMMESLGIKGLHDRKRLRHAIAMVTTCGAVKSSRAVLEQVADATGDEALKRACWSVDDVAKWLRSNGVEEKVCQVVRQKGIDGENLLYFEWKDFKELGVPEVGTCLTLQHEMIATKSAFFKAMGARIIGCRAVAGSEAPQPSSGQQAPPPAVPQDERVPDEYRCPITLEIMNDPVLAEDGCFYEREAITRWLSQHNTSPSTNALMGQNLATVFTLRSAILEYKQRNKQS